MPVLENYIIMPHETNATQYSQRFTLSHGEFDPGSGRTLAACLIHASRAVLFGEQRRTGEEHVSNRASGGGYRAERRGNPAYGLAVQAAKGKVFGSPDGGLAAH